MTLARAGAEKNSKNVTANERMSRLKDPFLILLSSILWMLPFHFGELWLLSAVAFVPYFFALERKSPGRAAQVSFFLGILFYFMLGYWLSFVNVLGFFLLAGYLALYTALFGYLVPGILWAEAGSYARDPGKSAWMAMIVASFWVILEYARGWVAGGIPWALLAYSQWKNLLFIQTADWV
ncbi:MAG: hypothetical protein HYZ87_02745, partial [Candidatus Omnitrophica bacterium]|nr:hypothetical protein [Candidatus Omnitrophota bacterium]